MAGVLKFLTVGLWILILSIWIGDLWVGIPVSVSDDVTKGLVEAMDADVDNAIRARRTVSAFLLIPTLMIFGLVVHGIRKKNDHLFHWGMILTIIPILAVGIVGMTQESTMPYKNGILLIMCVPLTIGLIMGLKGIAENRRSRS